MSYVKIAKANPSMREWEAIGRVVVLHDAAPNQWSVVGGAANAADAAKFAGALMVMVTETDLVLRTSDEANAYDTFRAYVVRLLGS